MKITNTNTSVFFDEFDNSAIITGDNTATTVAGKKYFVLATSSTTNIPVPVGNFFIAPSSGDQIELTQGDRIFLFDETRFCKTTASFEFSQGSVDAGDDCDPGATISDGIVAITGSLGALFDYDAATGEFTENTERIVNKFLDVVEDDGAGTYSLSPRNESQIFIMALLNNRVSAGQTQTWLFCPINVTSMSIGGGNADIQGTELSFSKGSGNSIIYKRKV